MAGLKLEHIYKVYPNGTKAVSDFTMDIQDQEFIVFVGPSGCGKSTTLRMIAGLEEISAGELYIDDRIVNDVEPKDRDIAMVFQNYALYPHMTVYENMAFGLQLRHMPTEEIHEKVMWAAEVLGLTDYLDRKPKAMSGGQRQRVALGRAILRNPKVMLLDEPLSNLDAKLRAQMRSEIAKLHKQLKTTFIYVTHDQIEAMTLGSRVVVMKLGRIQQVDTPKNLYDYPGNKFVAGFIGTPQMNFFEGTLLDLGKEVEITFKYSDAKIYIPREQLTKVNYKYLDGKHDVYIGIRCENIAEASKDDDPKLCIDCKVSHFEELGNETLIYGDINMQGDGFKETSTRVIFKGTPNNNIKIDNVVKIKLDASKLHFFDKETEESISLRIPKENILLSKIEGSKLVLGDKEVTLPKAITSKLSGNTTGKCLFSLDAILLNEGKEKATIVNIEEVNGNYLLHLKYGNNLIFTFGKKENKVNEVVKFDIDYTKVKFIDENGNKVIEELPEFDKVYGNFVNLNTYLYKTHDESITHEIEELKVKINSEYDTKVNEVKAKYTALKEEVSKKDYTSINKENNEELAVKTQKYKDQVNVLKAELKAKLTSEKNDYKAKVKETKDRIMSQYRDMFYNEKSTYLDIKNNNKDKDAIKRARAEFLERKENLPKERENEINNAINSLALNYETATSALKSGFKREKLALKKSLNELIEKAKKDKEPLKHIEKEETNEISVLEKERKEALSKAAIRFYFDINNTYFECNELISNKIIQALGTKVFIKKYLFKLPHDSYLLKDKGIEAIVKDNLDYGNKQFAVCECDSLSGKKETLILETKKPLEVDSKVYVDIDFTKSHIIETGLDIRLY